MHGISSPSRLSALCSSLRELDYDAALEVDVQELSNAAQACTNLETLRVMTWACALADFLKGLLCFDKPLLRELSLELQGDNSDFGETFRALGDHVGNLLSFFWVGSLEEKEGVDQAFVEGAPLLEKARIENDSTCHDDSDLSYER